MMSLELTIEKGIAIPLKNPQRKRQTTWEQMNVGDSVFSGKRKYGAATSWALRQKNEFEFLEKPERGGYRLWRIK